VAGASASRDVIAYPLLSQVDLGEDPICPRTFIWHVQFMDKFQKEASVLNFYEPVDYIPSHLTMSS
jgi:hypothetical protein